MPTITKMFTLDVTPEKFLEACTPAELFETALLLNSYHFQAKIEEMQNQDGGQQAIDELKKAFQ